MKAKSPSIKLKANTPEKVTPYNISADEIRSLVEESSNEKGYSLEEAEKIHQQRVLNIQDQLSNASDRS